MALKENKPGAGAVEKIFRHEGRRVNVFVSFMSLMGYDYIIYCAEGRASAEEAFALLNQLPFQVLESDEALGRAVAEIKASTPLSLADAWVTATAERLGAVLVHKDPEFKPLKNKIPLQALPYK